LREEKPSLLFLTFERKIHVYMGKQRNFRTESYSSGYFAKRIRLDILPVLCFPGQTPYEITDSQLPSPPVNVDMSFEIMYKGLKTLALSCGFYSTKKLPF